MPRPTRLNTDRILATLDKFDPDRRAVIVGGAALSIHLNELGWNDSHPISDVDTFMSDSGIKRLVKKYPQAESGTHSFTIGAGTYDRERIDYHSIEITPPKDGYLLPFSAHSGIRDRSYSTGYDELIDRSAIDPLTGRPIAPLGVILDWKMALRRQKDYETVRAVLELEGIESKLGRVRRAMTKRSLRMAAKRIATGKNNT